MQRPRETLHEGGTVVREVRRPAWSPAQIVALGVGLLLVVLGGVGLARAGTDFAHPVFSHSRVAGFGMTPLSALVELLLGVLVLAGSAYPGTAKALMSAFGVLMLAFGLVVALAPRPFAADWNYTARNGIFYAVVGAVLLISALLSPVFSSRREVIVRGSPSRVVQGPATDAPPGSASASLGPPAPDGRRLERRPLRPDEVPADPLAPQIRQRSR